MPNPRFMQTAGRWMNRELPEERIPRQERTAAELEESAGFSIDDILNGETFYSDKKDGSNYVGLPIALQEAIEHAGSEGIIATMPELIAAKVKADKSHEFWKQWYTVHTEENIGIDKKGRFYGRNNPVLVVVNGGGILTPDRIKQAYSDGLIGHSARYTENEFSELLEGRLPDGSSLNLYPYEDIKKGVSGLPHRFGVVMPYETARETKSGYHKREFLENPLAIARNGGRENLEEYYEKAKDRDNDLGNWHVYDNNRNLSVPQGRLLFLNDDHSGLVGYYYYLDYYGRFVGVAPEARSARK